MSRGSKKFFDGMIIIDFSNIMHQNVHRAISITKTKDIQENVSAIKHLILNSISSFISKYRMYSNEVIIACDNGSWRKKVFKYYKANRKKERDLNDIDYKALYKEMDRFIDEIKENFKYKVISIPNVEGDDIIGVLTIRFAEAKDGIVIISRDKDFKQLLLYPNVRLYDPIGKKEYDVEDAKRFLNFHILRGDSSDGIPNIKSDDDALANPSKRQKAFGEKAVDKFLDENEFTLYKALEKEGLMRNYKRNKRLISLFHIPNKIKEKIITTYYNTTIEGSTMKIQRYFIKNRMRNLLENIQEYR